VLAQVGNVVHERDARGEIGVGGVFGELGRTRVHDEDAVVGPDERRIQSAQRLHCARVGAADDHAVRFHEVVDGIPLLEELGVRGDGERMIGHAPDRVGNSLRGPNRDRGLGGNHQVTVHGAPDGLSRGQHVRKVRRSVLGGRCANRDQRHLRVSHGFGDVGGEVEAASLEILVDQLFEARLVNRDLAAP
jgi:hypothetical protein